MPSGNSSFNVRMGVKRDDSVSNESAYGACSTFKMRSMDKMVSWERSASVELIEGCWHAETEARRAANFA